MERILNYINGELVAPISGDYLDNFDPSRGAVYGEIPDSDAQDIDKAVVAAKAAFPGWSNTSRQERSNLMLKIAQLIDDNHEMLSQAESKDNGKPVKLARRVDIPRASANFRFFATAILLRD